MPTRDGDVVIRHSDKAPSVYIVERILEDDAQTSSHLVGMIPSIGLGTAINRARAMVADGGSIFRREEDTGEWEPSRPIARARSADARHRVPFDERPCSEQAVVSRPQQMSADPEEILHEPMYRREALHMGGRLEAPHLPFALARRLMGDFGSVVRVLVRGVDHRRHHGPMSRRITTQLVRDHASRN